MLKILIVDDELEILLLLQEMLLDHLCTSVTSVRSSCQAIELLKSGNEFDCIISDFIMPSGSGKILFEFNQKRTRVVPFILYTSCIEINGFSGEGFLGVVQKQNMSEILRLLQSQVPDIRRTDWTDGPIPISLNRVYESEIDHSRLAFVPKYHGRASL